MLIGLGGFASSGKDEVARILVREHGFKRVAFATPLREMLYALNPIIEEWDHKIPVRVQDLVDGLGWDMAKREYPEIRELLQRLGTEAGRNVLGQEVWVNLGLKTALEGAVSTVFSDCRFPNEAEAVLAAGGVVWNIVRPGVGPVNKHASDRGLPPDLVTRAVMNDGTLADLGHAVWAAVRSV